jgi:hypothetical protein
MNDTPDGAKNNERFGILTRSLAGLCHSCGICSYAARRPNSAFDKLMRWHRTWCPGWASHTKVYGEKQLLR